MAAQDIGAAARALAAARQPGALLQIEPRAASLIELRRTGIDRTAEGVLLDAAWERVHGRLPEGTVLRRVARSMFDAVVPGERAALIAAARGLLASLVAGPDLARLWWQLILVRISSDADRALMCDGASDVAAVAAGDVIAWVEPYDGDDWRVSGRYPTVTIEATLSTRR